MCRSLPNDLVHELMSSIVSLLCLGSDSEESDDGLDGQVAPYHLMEKRNLEKSILLELERDHHLKVQVCTGRSILFCLHNFSAIEHCILLRFCNQLLFLC
jgi:hypothetical protein